MNRLRNANWALILDKVGTVLVDRRFWQQFVIPTAIAIGLFPYLVDKDAVQLSDQAVAWSKLIVETFVPIVSAHMLSNSWTKRAPTGLDFKGQKTESDQLAETLLEAIKKN